MENKTEFPEDNPPRMERKLYKSSQNKVLDGVCGGIGEYLSVNPIWIRIIWVVLTIETGFFLGLVAYIAAAVIIPKSSAEEAVADHQYLRNLSAPVITVLGSALILVGIYNLLQNFNLIPWDLVAMTKYYIRNAFFPVLLIVLGVFLILYKSRK